MTREKGVTRPDDANPKESEKDRAEALGTFSARAHRESRAAAGVTSFLLFFLSSFLPFFLPFSQSQRRASLSRTRCSAVMMLASEMDELATGVALGSALALRLESGRS